MKSLLTLFFCVMLLMHSALCNQDRIERPQRISISYSSGESAIFTMKAERVVAIDIDLGATQLKVPAEIVEKINKIHFDSVVLLWNGSFKKAIDADLVSIKFPVGSETDKQFGEFPYVQLVFENKHFLSGTVRIKTSDNSEEGRPL